MRSSSFAAAKVVCGIIAVFGLWQCKPKPDAIQPQRKDITQAVYASGKIYPLHRQLLASKVGGYVEQLHVSVGQIIEAQSPLISIQSQLSDINVSSAKNNYEQASENAANQSALLRTAREDVATARVKYELDSTNYTRFSNLYKQGATAKINLDQAKAQFETSRQLLQKASLQLRSVEQKVSLELKNARNAYQSQLAARADYVIYADRKVRVYDIRPKTGDLIAPQMPLIEVGHTDSFEVELNVDETDINLIKEGQPIIYEIEALKNKFCEGNIIKRYPVVNPLNKTAKVVASIRTKEPIQFFSGMSVEANIIIAQKPGALVIPKNYLIDGDYVKVLSDGQEKKVKIVRGIEDLEYVEIISGIDANTQLVPNIP